MDNSCDCSLEAGSCGEVATQLGHAGRGRRAPEESALEALLVERIGLSHSVPAVITTYQKLDDLQTGICFLPL